MDGAHLPVAENKNIDDGFSRDVIQYYTPKHIRQMVPLSYGNHSLLFRIILAVSLLFDANYSLTLKNSLPIILRVSISLLKMETSSKRKVLQRRNIYLTTLNHR